MKTHNPIFLQAAGRGGKTPFAGIKVLSPIENPIIGSVDGNGDITVTSIKDGEKISNTYSDPKDLTVSVQADANTWVIITGEITVFSPNEYHIEKVVAYNNTALTYLNCYDCHDLIVLDVRNNTALDNVDCGECSVLKVLCIINNTTQNSLDCGNNPALDSIKYGAENENVATSIAYLITENEALDGTVYTNSEGAYYSTIADAATAAGWTIAQL